jgi:hypothetical protein
VLTCATAFGAFLSRLARAWRTGRHEPAAPGRGLRLWLTASLGLLAIYGGQESLEGLLASGHPQGLVGIFGDHRRAVRPRLTCVRRVMSITAPKALQVALFLVSPESQL